MSASITWTNELLQPFLGGVEQTNCISGRLKLGKETLATLEGYWDGTIYIKDKRTGEQQVFWNSTPSVRRHRLTRYTVSVDHQEEYESERLWQHVSAAILRDDMNAATEEKTTLEEAQRGRVAFGLLTNLNMFCSTFERAQGKVRGLDSDSFPTRFKNRTVGLQTFRFTTVGSAEWFISVRV